MKFIAAVAFALLVAFASSQAVDRDIELGRGRRSSGAALTSSRMQLQGAIGPDQNNLDMQFSGWSTNLIVPDKYELHHCSAKVLKEQDMSSIQRGQDAGKIIHSYAFYDKKAGTYRSFTVLRNKENDLGTCWAFEGDENQVDIDEWTVAQQKCGPAQDGQVLTRRSTFTDSQGQPLTAISAVCKTQDKITNLYAEILAGNKPIAVMQAENVRDLPVPKLDDRATILELSVPPSCFLGDVRSFDVQDIMSFVSGEGEGEGEELERGRETEGREGLRQ